MTYRIPVGHLSKNINPQSAWIVSCLDCKALWIKLSAKMFNLPVLSNDFRFGVGDEWVKA